MDLLTPNELSRILKLHPFTVTRLAREGLSAVPGTCLPSPGDRQAAQAGKLPAFKVGGVWRFQKDEFEKWVEERTNGNRRHQKNRKTH